MTETVNSNPFPATAPLAPLQQLRSYNRRNPDGTRETWDQTCDRTTNWVATLGKFTPGERRLIDTMQRNLIAFGAARVLWVGGTPWIDKPENYSGAFNCTSRNITCWEDFAILMDLAMQGSGTGAVLEEQYLQLLPPVTNTFTVNIVGQPGDKPKEERQETTVYEDLSDEANGHYHKITVGDSRQGWCDGLFYLLMLASKPWASAGSYPAVVEVDLSSVRPKNEKLSGFGGTANPEKLGEMFVNVAKVLRGAYGRRINAHEASLILGHSANAVVAGNIRRSAGMRQGSDTDDSFTTSKDNLWVVDAEGNWKIDPERDCLRTANHTRVYHHKPTLEECIESVRKQFYSGEGAIQYAPEAIARASADLLDDAAKRELFLNLYALSQEEAYDFLVHLLHVREYDFAAEAVADVALFEEATHRMQRYALNPCGEITGVDFHCNLGSVHVNQIDPADLEMQVRAFQAAALQVAALLQRGFVEERFQRSRELDPIVGVSFTGAFTFFVKAFGIDWLRWWQAGRPREWGKETVWSPLAEPFSQTSAICLQSEFYLMREMEYLYMWSQTVHMTVGLYCHKHGLKVPNRCTTLKPEGSMTLLTGVGACGWHPPKAAYYIRRMTFGAYDPIAMAAIDYGYTVVPSQSCKDAEGNLLDDPFDSRVTEWLVEVPVKEPWADIEGADEIDPSTFPIEAQWDFYMQTQIAYTTHNSSATLEIYEDEIETLGKLIYDNIQNNEGYISAAVLGRSKGNLAFPRLPFEPISKEKYEALMAGVLQRRENEDFLDLVEFYDGAFDEAGPQDSGCSSTYCEAKSSQNP